MTLTHQLPKDFQAVREDMVQFHTEEADKLRDTAKSAITVRDERYYKAQADVHDRMAARWANTTFK